MKKVLLFLLVMLSLSAFAAEGDGVKFFEGSFRQALAKAKKEKKLIMFDAYTSWCGPCKEEMPYLRSFYEKAKGKVSLIGVDVEEATFDDGRLFVERNGIVWPNLYDPDGRSRKYFGLGVPVTWFIAADGSVAGKKIGVLKNEMELITLTDKYLGVKL